MKNQALILSNLKPALIGTILLYGLYLTNQYNFLLFHSLSEIFGIVIACGIFMVAWNSRHFVKNNYMLFIGIAYLFIAFLDLLHTLAYKGMGVFQGHGVNVAVQLWISNRGMESISLLAAPLLIGRNIRAQNILASYAVVTSVLVGAIFYWDIFPVCFIEGIGLTPFKKISEYIISLILVLSIFVLYKKQKEFDRTVFRLLTASIFLTILSELSFTFYIDLYGLSNVTGHYLKIISFYLIYKAIIESGLMKPYDLLFRDLKQSEELLRDSEEQFRTLAEQSPVSIQIMDPEGRTVKVNRAWEKLWGITSADLDGYNILEDVQFEQLGVMPYLKKGFSGEPVFIPAAEYDVHKTFGKGARCWVQAHIYPVKNESGNITTVVLMHEDITERKKAEDQLKKVSNEWEVTFNSISDPISIHNRDFEIVKMNRAFADLCKMKPEDIFGRKCYEVIHGKNEPWDACPHKKSCDHGKAFTEEFFEPGLGIYLQVSTSPIFDESGEIFGSVHMARDITERKKAEELINASLKEKEVLMKEIHHRVKNNMTVISSLLNLQSGYIEDAQYKEMFNESMNRIKTMALIHEKLYRSKDLARIKFSDYIEDMADSIYKTYGLNFDQIKLKQNIEKTSFSIDVAIPCGLIVNELLSNSLKHAFPENREGEISVTLLTNDKDEIELTVGDNGVGMPEGLNFRHTDSLGMNLINGLVTQLQGKIELHTEKGTEFRITFARRA
jgi:PAS domain S-box-containing protein